MAGEHLDLSSDGPEPANESTGRPFVGMHFACCGVYARLYINRAGTGYEGHCPRCGRPARVLIGPNGSDSRFFTAR